MDEGKGAGQQPREVSLVAPVYDKFTLPSSLPLALVSSLPGKGLTWPLGSNLPCPGYEGDLILLDTLWPACLGEGWKGRAIRIPLTGIRGEPLMASRTPTLCLAPPGPTTADSAGGIGVMGEASDTYSPGSLSSPTSTSMQGSPRRKPS